MTLIHESEILDVVRELVSRWHDSAYRQFTDGDGNIPIYYTEFEIERIEKFLNGK